MSRSYLTNLVFAVTMISIAFTTTRVQADILTGQVMLSNTQTIHNGDKSGKVYVTPILITNHTSGQDAFAAFCGDFTTSTSAGFSNASGQAYGAYSLWAGDLTMYSDTQKHQINDLFNYAYATAFDTNGTVINQTYASAFQLTLWEVLTETTPTLNITNGSFYLSASKSNQGLIDTTNSWLDALIGNTSWESLGLISGNYDLTVYVAEGGKSVSQTLISVMGPPTTTPEPATLMVLGLGLMGLGLARTRRQK